MEWIEFLQLTELISSAYWDCFEGQWGNLLYSTIPMSVSKPLWLFLWWFPLYNLAFSEIPSGLLENVAPRMATATTSAVAHILIPSSGNIILLPQKLLFFCLVRHLQLLFSIWLADKTFWFCAMQKRKLWHKWKDAFTFTRLYQFE